MCLCRMRSSLLLKSWEKPSLLRVPPRSICYFLPSQLPRLLLFLRASRFFFRSADRTRVYTDGCLCVILRSLGCFPSLPWPAAVAQAPHTQARCTGLRSTSLVHPALRVRVSGHIHLDPPHSRLLHAACLPRLASRALSLSLHLSRHMSMHSPVCTYVHTPHVYFSLQEVEIFDPEDLLSQSILEDCPNFPVFFLLLCLSLYANVCQCLSLCTRRSQCL